MPADPAVRVRELVPEDWREVRPLRLEALADTPIGYLDTHARALRDDDAAWRERVRRWTTGASATCFAQAGDAQNDDEVLGMLGVSLDAERDGRAWLLAVYVRPAARGTGVLDAMVRHAAGWATARRVHELALEVHEDNVRARRAYARLGWVETGGRRPYDLDPDRDELLMTRPV